MKNQHQTFQIKWILYLSILFVLGCDIDQNERDNPFDPMGVAYSAASSEDSKSSVFINSVVSMSSDLQKSSEVLVSSVAKSSSAGALSSVSVSSVVSSSVTLSSIAKSSSQKMSSSQVSSSAATSSASLAFTNPQSCSYSLTNTPSVGYGTLSCAEKVYKTIRIDAQVWLAENLNYGNYISDGALGSTMQSEAQKFCFSNIESNCNVDGGLYQWHTMLGFSSSCATITCDAQISGGHHQGICPIGWHIPKAAEWEVLAVYLGGSTVAGSKMKLNNTAQSNWNATGFNNGNSSGFSALPAGFRNSGGGFYSRTNYAYFREITEKSGSLAYFRDLSDGTASLGRGDGSKMSGFSVRCVKD